MALATPVLDEDVDARALLCGVRPENVRLTADDAALRAEVRGVEYLGSCQIVTLNTAAGTTLRAKLDVNAPAAYGDHVGLQFEPGAISLFDAASGRALRTTRNTGSLHG